MKFLIKIQTKIFNFLNRFVAWKYIFLFHGLVFIFLLTAIVLFTHSGLSCYIFILLIIVWAGHSMISSLMVYLHEKAETKKVSKDEVCMFLMQTAGILEIFFFSFLLIFHQTNIIIGYLVVKTIWNYPIEKDISNKIEVPNTVDLVVKQTEANSIFRIGIILALLVSFFAVYISNYYYDLKKDNNFKTINEIFNESTK